ncbi:MAG: succinylglutamate desuccinylase/aspartoacylase family protein [Saprospiraceae bacterium]|nr:succinylglutamate desuccinylase/aspartoacylase family protein [Candidatus Vicinibacter affinis]
MIRINAGRLPSGNRISIFAYVFRSKNPGPVALFMGGMHGDEINGLEIVRRSITDGMFTNLKCGSVICIPLLNIFGFINFSRDVPDGKDVNRSFPGSMTGSLASRVARLITKKILSLVDFGIDFHTGGRDHWNEPQLRFSPKSPESYDLARQCEFPLLVEKAVVSKSLRKIAKDLKKLNLLIKKGMLDGELKSLENVKVFRKTIWDRSPEGCLLTYRRKAGEFVRKDELIAILNDPFGQKETRMYASRDGFILGHNNAPVVNMGDGMFHLAYD